MLVLYREICVNPLETVPKMSKLSISVRGTMLTIEVAKPPSRYSEYFHKFCSLSPTREEKVPHLFAPFPLVNSSGVPLPLVFHSY